MQNREKLGELFDEFSKHVSICRITSIASVTLNSQKANENANGTRNANANANIKVNAHVNENANVNTDINVHVKVIQMRT